MSDTTAAADEVVETDATDTTTSEAATRADDTSSETTADQSTADVAQADGETADTSESDDKATKGEMPENWRDLAADGDEDTLKLLKRYGSVKGVAKALREANDKIRSGKAGVSDEPMPDPEKEPDKAKAWRKERGIPDDPTGYVLPESVTQRAGDADKPLLTSFTEYAHAKGAPQQVVDIASEWYFDSMEQMEAERIAADQEASSAAEEELRKDWGAEYKGNLKLAARFVESIPGVGPAWAEARLPDGTRLGDNPAFMAWASDQGRNTFGDAVFASSDSERRHNDRKAEIEQVMKTDINRYYAEGLDKELLEINQREEKRRR